MLLELAFTLSAVHIMLAPVLSSRTGSHNEYGSHIDNTVNIADNVLIWDRKLHLVNHGHGKKNNIFHNVLSLGTELDVPSMSLV